MDEPFVSHPNHTPPDPLTSIEWDPFMPDGPVHPYARLGRVRKGLAVLGAAVALATIGCAEEGAVVAQTEQNPVVAVGESAPSAEEASVGSFDAKQVGNIVFNNSPHTMRDMFENQINYESPVDISATAPSPDAFIVSPAEDGTVKAQDLLDKYLAATSLAAMTGNTAYLDNITGGDWTQISSGLATNKWNILVETGAIETGGVIKIIEHGLVANIVSGESPGEVLITGEAVSTLRLGAGVLKYVRSPFAMTAMSLPDGNVVVTNFFWDKENDNSVSVDGDSDYGAYTENGGEIPFFSNP